MSRPAGPGSGSGSDVLIIGGGVIGLAIAWRAAQRGLRVTVADPEPGHGASHAAAGMLTPVSEAAYAERALFTLGQQSLQRYPAFVAELTAATGEPTGFRDDGTLQVAYDHDDLAVLDEIAVLRNSFGVPSQRLSARESRVPDDASVDPRLVTAALLAAARQAGVTVIPQAVTQIIAAAGRAEGAVLADGTRLQAGSVVLAAGWQSALVGGLPEGTAPRVRPVKGQILRLRPTPATLRAGLQPGLVTRTVRGIVHGFTVYLVPRASGELVIGATQEELGSDTRVTAGGVWELLRDARTLVPGITEFELAEAVAGLRPGTPDNAPILGPAQLPGLVLATGHFRSGVLLAPVTADIIADYLASQRISEGMVPFSAERFSRPDRPAGPRHTGPQPSRPPAAPALR